jgi:hypothetical protein
MQHAWEVTPWRLSRLVQNEANGSMLPAILIDSSRLLSRYLDEFQWPAADSCINAPLALVLRTSVTYDVVQMARDADTSLSLNRVR